MENMLKFTGSETVREKDLASCVADIPEYRPDRNPQEEYADSPETLIWHPSSDLDEKSMEAYIRTAKSIFTKKQQDQGAEKNAAVKVANKDSYLEYILGVLHESEGDKSVALHRLRKEEMPKHLTEKWTHGEMTAFRKGLGEYKKDFEAIRMQFSLNRSMTEIISHYYAWKRAGWETKGKVASRPHRFFTCPLEPKNHVLTADTGRGATTRKRLWTDED